MKVLIIADDLAESKQIASMLDKRGDKTVMAPSAREALHQLEKTLLDLIITDIDLPDGKRILSYVRKHPRTKNIPVVVISQNSDGKTVRECLELGAAGFIVKPVDAEILWGKLAGSTGHSKRAILIVDDDNLLRDVLSKMVGRGGFQAHQAASGSEALEFLGKNRVDAVISDIMMPGMDGLELLSQIKNRYQRIPVLMITGHGAKYSKEEVAAAGADGYITKPFQNTDILQKLATLVH